MNFCFFLFSFTINRRHASFGFHISNHCPIWILMFFLLRSSACKIRINTKHAECRSRSVVFFLIKYEHALQFFFWFYLISHFALVLFIYLYEKTRSYAVCRRRAKKEQIRHLFFAFFFLAISTYGYYPLKIKKNRSRERRRRKTSTDDDDDVVFLFLKYPHRWRKETTEESFSVRLRCFFLLSLLGLLFFFLSRTVIYGYNEICNWRRRYQQSSSSSSSSFFSFLFFSFHLFLVMDINYKYK